MRKTEPLKLLGDFMNFLYQKGLTDQGIEELEKIVDNAVVKLQKNKKGLKKLTGYEWIKDQWNRAGEFYETI